MTSDLLSDCHGDGGGSGDVCGGISPGQEEAMEDSRRTEGSMAAGFERRRWGG